MTAMGNIVRGLLSVLVALGIIAIVGTGVILYYNTVKPEDETAAIETAASGETIAVDVLTADADTAGTDDQASAETSDPSDTSDKVFSAENGHQHTYTATILRPATCTENGEVRYDCYCGDYYVDSIPSLEHKAGDWITVRVATATQTGLKQQCCSVCGRVLKEEVIPMLTSADTSSTGTKKKDTVDHQHSYTYEITSEASCTEPGEKTFTCSICGSTFKTKIAATNHPSRKTIVTEGNCGEAGKIEIKCNICGVTISSETLTYDHNWGDWTTTKEATTSAEGEQTRTCKTCGQTETKTIAKLSGSSSSGSGSSGSGSSGSGSSGSGDSTCAHTYTSAVTTPATCTTNGITTYTCSKCGNAYTESAPTATGHRWNNWFTEVKATTETTGLKKRVCSTCGATEEQVIDKLEEIHKHDYTFSVIVETAATCTESGTRKHICSCGAFYTSTIPALGHIDVKGTSAGGPDNKCDRCGISM